MLIPMTLDQILELYEPVEAYCPDCAQFHKTYKKTTGHIDFPIALCDECEETWKVFLSEHCIPATN